VTSSATVVSCSAARVRPKPATRTRNLPSISAGI
jgi:hypothetical protein